MAGRTARGTAVLKTSGTTLTSSSFTLPAGHALEVAITCENSQGPPTSVTMNGRPLKRKRNQNNATAGINTSMWIKARAAVAQTGTIVATWSSAVLARVMYATSWDTVLRIDGSASQSDAPTTTPATGLTAALKLTDAIALCAFGSAGPSGDTQATSQRIFDGGSWVTANLGQRAGTTGGAATSNVTIQETWLELTALDATQGDLSGVTQRRWANAILALGGPSENQASMGVFDVDDARVIFDGKVTPIIHEHMYFHFNEEDDLWEVYDRGADIPATDTRVASYVVDTGMVAD